MPLLQAQQQPEVLDVLLAGEPTIVRSTLDLGIGEPDFVVGTGTSLYLLVAETVSRFSTGSFYAGHVGKAARAGSANDFQVLEPGQSESVAKALALIRYRLSAGVQDLAQMLRVSRPTIYGWMGGTQEPQPRNLDRLTELESAAGKIVARFGRPVPRPLLLASVRGARLLDLLSDEVVVEESVDAQVVELVQRSGPRESESVFDRIAAEFGETIDMPEDAQERAKDLTGTSAS